MKKKIIFLVVCAVLLLFFASSSYGELDPKYKLRGHPWQEMDLCPGQDSTIINYDKSVADNIIGVSMIRILGINFVLIKGMNSVSSLKSSLHKPYICRENER